MVIVYTNKCRSSSFICNFSVDFEIYFFLLTFKSVHATMGLETDVIKMTLSASEKIKIILNRRKMTLTQLAEKTGQSRQNISNKISRDNFTKKELHLIAEALDCSVEIRFIMNDTGENI